MTAFDTGVAITALRRTALAAAADAIRSGRSLDAINRAFQKRYHQVTRGGDPTGAWQRLEVHARILAAWPSSRHAAVERLAALGVAIPVSLMTAEHRVEQARRSYATNRRALQDRRRRGENVVVPPRVATPDALATLDPLPPWALSRDDLVALGVDVPTPDVLVEEALAALADAVEARRRAA